MRPTKPLLAVIVAGLTLALTTQVWALNGKVSLKGKALVLPVAGQRCEVVIPQGEARLRLDGRAFRLAFERPLDLPATRGNAGVASQHVGLSWLPASWRQRVVQSGISFLEPKLTAISGKLPQGGAPTQLTLCFAARGGITRSVDVALPVGLTRASTAPALGGATMLLEMIDQLTLEPGTLSLPGAPSLTLTTPLKLTLQGKKLKAQGDVSIAGQRIDLAKIAASLSDKGLELGGSLEIAGHKATFNLQFE